MQLEASVLGRIELRAGERVVTVGGPRQRRLLGMLLVRLGDVVPTYELIDAVWAGGPPPAAERTFRSYVARLRRSLDQVGVDGSDVVVTAPAGYSLSRCVEVDAARFELLLNQARRRLELGDPTAAQRLVERALDCWNGNAFGEFAHEEWAVAEAVRLDELHLVARELAVEAALELGALDAAVADAGRLAGLHPLRERPHHLLMHALYRSGRQVEAVRVGCEYQLRLRDDAGIDPSRRIAELEQQILQSDPGLDRRPARSVRGYQLGAVLGSGPVAVMHRAHRHAEGGELVLHAVPEHVADAAAFIRDFELGARRRAATRHPGLVPWHDFWREPGAAYVVTGLPTGGSLGGEATEPDDLEVGALADFVRDIGEALHCLHDAGIVYGELTAQDVWFERGRPVLIGPVPSIAQPTRRCDDVVAFAELVRDLLAQGRLTTGGLTAGGSERLHRLIGSACDGAFGEDLARLVDEILWLVGASRNGAQGAADANPYRGLEAFEERHAPLFFGRRSAVDQLAGQVRQHPFVSLVGASGSGKSSVVRAGLVPHLRADGWLTTVIQPGSHPFDELGLALEAISTVGFDRADDPGRLARVIGEVIGPDERVLLVIDQFEELWTAAAPEQRDAVLATLDQLARDDRSGVHTVVTLRADYLGHALGHSLIGSLMRDHTVLLAPMSSDELAEAIVEPARAVGVTVETELAAAMVADAGRSEGSLPLVQFALSELFEQRDAGVMRLDSYRRIGGLAGVIARRAEDTFGRLAPDEQRAAELALTRLVAVDSAGDPTRRRVPNAELAESAADVIAEFGRARLLTFDRDRSTREQVVEIAHESLAREWPRFREWIAADRESLLVLRRLSSAASSWASSGREPTDLYRGTRLEVTEEWVRTHPDRLTAVEQEFLQESRLRADAEQRSERSRSQRLQRLTVGLAAVLVVALVAGIVAVVQRRDAMTSADEAERRTIETTSQRLATEAVDALEMDPDLAILLALESVRRTDAAGLPSVAGAVAALHTTTQSSRLLARFEGISVSAISHDGQRAVLASDDGQVALVDLATQDRIASTTFDDEVIGLQFGPDGDRLVAATASRLAVLDGLDLSTLASEDVECCIVALEIHPDGDRVAGEIDAAVDEVRTWALDGLRAERTIDDGRLAGWIDDDVVVFGSSGARLVGASGSVRELDVPVEPLVAVDVHPDGRRLLAADGEGVSMWSIATGELDPVALDGWGVLFQEVVFDQTGEGVLAYGPSDEVRWRSIEDAGSHSLRGHPSVLGLSSGADGQRLLASGEGETLLWDVSVEGPPELGALGVSGDVWGVEFSHDGRVLYVTDQVGGTARVRAVDLATRTTSGEAEFGAVGGFYFPTVTPAGLVAGWDPNGGSRIEDLTSGEVVVELGPCRVPAAIDADGRWLVVHGDLEFLPGCPPRAGTVLDPATGDVLLELPEPSGLTDIGPPGTISDGLAAYQSGDGGVTVRDLQSGDLVGRIEGVSAWRPFFSNDGRHLTFGSWSDGGFAIDMQRVLDGSTMADAVVINPQGEGATSFSVVAGDQLVTGQGGVVLRFWDLEDGGLRLELPVNSGDTTFIAPTPDDRHLYYEDEGTLLRRFPLDLDELVELAEQRVQRDFRPAECERYRLADDCESFLARR